MPFTIPQPQPNSQEANPTGQPYYVRQREHWAINNMRQNHMQALYMYGEWTMFCLMWSVHDEADGLVERCSICYETNRSASAYRQGAYQKCPSCYGTSFEGGYRALIIRPAIYTDSDEDQKWQERGVANRDDLFIESTPDFRVRSGDYAFRATGERYQLSVPQRITLRTGFEVPWQRETGIGYNHATATLEDESTSVAYTIPPSNADLMALLDINVKAPVDWTQYETIRAPLIPLEEQAGDQH